MTTYDTANCPKNICDKTETPCYLISEDLIEKNCRILQDIQNRTGVKILLALKAFALPDVFPLIRKYITGVCASGAIEARLGYEEFSKEVHTYAPAYSDAQISEVIEYSDHILFNSFSQLAKHKEKVREYSATHSKEIKIGLRVNPEYSEITTDLYNPCITGSRFGIKAKDFLGKNLADISGIHFHAMCEQGADVLERILQEFEDKFAHILYNNQISWVNFGGGHHITQNDYDIDLLCKLITRFKNKFDVDVYLEPGEAVVLNAGFYITTVLDIIKNDMNIAIVDGSAETHLPDVLAMPYRPELLGSGKTDEKNFTYRLGGISCLAGDVIGDYSFDSKLKVGQRLCFTDMALYSFVKNNTFNGVELPAIYSYSLENKNFKTVRKFDYTDYRDRITAKECK